MDDSILNRDAEEFNLQKERCSTTVGQGKTVMEKCENIRGMDLIWGEG